MLASAHAAGLGRLSVQSALGQPLRAEIELTAVAADELESLQPRLAPADAYRQANIELTPALLSLRFSVERRASGPVVRVTSTQPINEPFVDMLMELGGNRGRLVREYTFLLDPPELRNGRTASVAPIINSQVQQSTVTTPLPSTPVPVAPASDTPRPEPRAVPAPTPAPAATARPAPRAVPAARPAKTVQEHTVKKGDTLANIANQYREPGVSLDQMLVALYRANPDAFVGKNMNRLRAGQILSIPAATEAETISAGEARGVVVAQTADFNAYRNKLASQVAGSQARRTEEGRQSSGGSITARVQEEGGATASQDRLRLSKAGADANAGTAAGATTRSGVTEEELIARDKAIAEANARVRELEKNVSELQKLLEIKNQDLAARQQQAEAGAAASTSAAAPAPTSVAPSPVEADKPAEAAVTPPTAEKPAEEKPVAETGKPPAKPPVVAPVQPPTAAEPSFFDDLSNNPMFLPGAGVLLALLAALGIYSSRRRKQPAKTFEDSILSDSSLKSNSLFGATGGQSVDTNNSVFNSNFVPSASQLDTNEVDPIAEADVYIAYGRDAQAEEILKEALRNQPDRHAVRLKLLEIYSMRGDVRAFEVLATELYSMTRGEGPEWAQAATMGAALDPDNPLYASAVVNNDGNSKFASVLTAATVLAATEKDVDELLAFGSEVATDGSASHKGEEELSFSEPSLLGDVTQIDEPAAPLKVEIPVLDEPHASMADLEFDLDGFDDQAKTPEARDTLSPTELAPADLPPEVAAINFDFLDKGEPSAPVLPQEDAPLAVSTPAIAPELTDEPPVPAPAAAPEVLLPEAFDLEFPSDSPPAAEPPAPASTAKPEDFDLSDISLELDPLSSSSGNTLPPLEGLDDEASYSGSAEMATKLDLALAYQEIGDKEGARELLEEVVKGGNSEQSARATALLAKLD